MSGLRTNTKSKSFDIFSKIMITFNTRTHHHALHNGTILVISIGFQSSSSSCESSLSSIRIHFFFGIPAGHNITLLVHQDCFHQVPELPGTLLHDQLSIWWRMFFSWVWAPDCNNSSRGTLDCTVKLVNSLQTLINKTLKNRLNNIEWRIAHLHL